MRLKELKKLKEASGRFEKWHPGEDKGMADPTHGGGKRGAPQGDFEPGIDPLTVAATMYAPSGIYGLGKTGVKLGQKLITNANKLRNKKALEKVVARAKSEPDYVLKGRAKGQKMLKDLESSTRPGPQTRSQMMKTLHGDEVAAFDKLSAAEKIANATGWKIGNALFLRKPH